MNIRTSFWLSLVGFTGLISLNAFAQKTYRDLTDSLLAQGIIKKNVQSFYIKPVFEQYRSLVVTQGDGFTAPLGDLVRTRSFGIRIGYNWNAFEMETGLSIVRPFAGYRYILTGSTGYTTVTRSTDFYHLPVIFRYQFWQPIKKLSLRVGVGTSYNVDLNKLPLASGGISEEFTQDASGNRIVLARTSDQYEQKKSFFSGELNLSAQYHLFHHFSTNLEVRRLFSPMDVVRYTATQQTFNPPAIRTVESRGGANSFSINLGLLYKFGFNNGYKLN